MKICRKCLGNKDLSSFTKQKGYPDGRKNICNACRNEQRRERYANNSSRVVSNNLKSKYGINLEQYICMFKKQNGLCAICNEPETCVRAGKVMSLSVDHCHTSGDIRGLLCNDCNRGIGLLKDDAKTLLKAYEYITKNHTLILNVLESRVAISGQ